MDTKRFSTQLYGNKYQVDGILGTSVFYQFLTTLDYVNEKIVFEIIDDHTALSIEEKCLSTDFHRIPFWMAGDHYMLVKGKVNNGNENLFFLDTGLGGMAFTCPKSTLNQNMLVLKKNVAFSGLGGGGKVNIIPFDIAALSVGDLCERELQGAYGPFPGQIENSFGFRIGGLISHQFFRNHSITFDFSNMVLEIK